MLIKYYNITTVRKFYLAYINDESEKIVKKVMQLHQKK